MKDDMISRQAAIEKVKELCKGCYLSEHCGKCLAKCLVRKAVKILEKVSPAQPVNIAKLQPNCNQVASDCISRQAAIKTAHLPVIDDAGYEVVRVDDILALPSAQPGQRYTEEELSVFAHGISLSLLSKRSAQHWRYDEDTATEIKFLERLYEKVSADMKGEQG